MFDKLKNALFGRSAPGASAADAMPRDPSVEALAKWATAQGYSFSRPVDSDSFSILGKVSGKPWRVEVGRPSRAYIRGEELRARAELGVSDDVAVMAMSRSLKDLLEKQAYDRYTDSLQTSVDHSLPEEVRWLATFEEFGWDSLPRTVWSRYAVMGNKRADAEAWLNAELADQLLTWPAANSADVPLVLMILRGKAYLRMQQTPGDTATVQHATRLFTTSCQAALAAFKKS